MRVRAPRKARIAGVTRPRWLWLASASFVAYFVFLQAELNFGRELFGFAYVRTEGGVIATPVPGGPFAEAGVQPGDRIIAIGGLPVRDPLQMTVVRGAIGAGSPARVRVQRAGETLDLTTPPMRRSRGTQEPLFAISFVPLAISLAFGLLIAWRGGSDTSSRLGAWLLASMGCVFLPVWPNGMAHDWRDLPAPIGLLLWPAAISSLLPAILLFVFAARGSNPLLSWRATLLWASPAIASMAYVAFYLIQVVYAPQRAIELPLPAWFQVVGPALYPVYGAAGAWLLWLNWRRLTDITDRRRARTLFTGTAIGGAGMALLAISVGAMQSGRPFPGAMAMAYAGLVTFSVLPLTFAYATLRHRLFDLRVIIRLGLQYAVARGFIVALIPLAIAILIVDLVRHGDQPLQQILAARGWSYGLFVAVILIIHLNRDRWMSSLDRRFFRDRYASQQILRAVVEDISATGDFRAAASRVVNRVDSALHPVMVAILAKPRPASAFTAIAALPATHMVPTLGSASPITQIVRALGRPVSFGSTGVGDVPADQQRWLTEAGVELVVPISTDPSQDEAMLVLGPRRSEEPYSKEDVDLLASVAASLGLLTGRSTDPGDSTTRAVIGAGPLPKISDRYRIERPIGHGGMGVVYAAVDETLDRAVAIKVIRDQHLRGADAVARFQREARTAASLSHPHIVTIHDYGIDDTGSPYLVMELLDGVSLRSAIVKDGRMTPARALAILSGLASAVDAAHAKGIIHRDLKPENVFLVGNTTHAKILDYGIAKAMASAATHATTGVVLGTPAYMAPEQASGGGASPAWDHWALSVIAYELFTGRHPFRGGLPITSAIPIRTLAPNLDENIASAIDHALTLDSSKRLQQSISGILTG